MNVKLLRELMKDMALVSNDIRADLVELKMERIDEGKDVEKVNKAIQALRDFAAICEFEHKTLKAYDHGLVTFSVVKGGRA